MDFLILEVTARVIATAFEVFGITNKTEQPKNLPSPADLATRDNFKKLHKAAAKIVDKLVVNKEMMDKTIETMVSAEERLEMISQIELNPYGRFKYEKKSLYLSVNVFSAEH